MSPPDRNEALPARQPTAIEREALEWVARLDRGMTPAEEAEFARWLAADPRHAAMFGEFDGTWSLLDRVRELPEAVAATPDSRRQARRSGVRRWAVPVSLAAAAVVVVAYVRWPLANADGERNTPYAASVATELGEMRKVALPDGSSVHLNTDSAVDVQFSAAERRLRLTRGEAHFTVATNRARPFTVSAGGVDVRAVGTVFNVRLRSAAVEVLVTEGKVMVGDEPSQHSQPTGAESAVVRAATSRDGAVDAGRPSPPSLANRALTAGEKITIPLVPGSGAVAPPAASVVVPLVEIEQALAWQERRLEFVSAPLADMVAEFNRYNRRKLVIADAALGAQRFGGVFRPDDAAGFVRALEVNFGVVAEQRTDVTILRLASP